MPEYPRYDEVVDSPNGLMHITTFLDTTCNLSLMALNEHEQNFNKYIYIYIYGSLNLMIFWHRVTDKEHM